MSSAVLSLGSNMGDRIAYLRGAVTRLEPWLAAVSDAYETPPWGPVAQEPYLNAVALVEDPDAAPGDWLARAQEAERAAGRVRSLRWGPRTLDVDVVTVDEVRSSEPGLTLPHPRAHERAFVLVPWLAVAPEARLAGIALPRLIEALGGDDVAQVRRLPGVSLR